MAGPNRMRLGFFVSAASPSLYDCKPFLLRGESGERGKPAIVPPRTLPLSLLPRIARTAAVFLHLYIWQYTTVATVAEVVSAIIPGCWQVVSTYPDLTAPPTSLLLHIRLGR
jgi:hypothetical protein